MTFWLHLRALAEELARKRPWPADGDVQQPSYDYSEEEHQKVQRILREAATALEAAGYES